MPRRLASRVWREAHDSDALLATPVRTTLSLAPLTFVCTTAASGQPRAMETPDKSDQGYPEEAPDEVAGDEGASQEGSRDKEAEENAPDNEDGTATGNPNAAG